MLTREDNELITHTDPGTPCGELMRRYWQPAALSDELPVGGAPVPIRLLGEDLVLWRDDQGRPGLLGLHCSHRGADLSYGRLEDGGLRCIYHGWLYDINGRCLEQPGEPAGSTFYEKIRHTAYPCIERARVIFAYLGPTPAPEFPSYEFLNRPLDNGNCMKYYHECNYLQANEGNYDLSHLNFLHYMRGMDELQNGVKATDMSLRHQGMVPPVLASPIALTPFGMWSGKIRGGPGFEGEILTATEFVLPNFTAFANGRPNDARDQDGYTVNWHVPIDDTHHWKYTFDYSRRGPMERGVRTEMVDYQPVRNATNRYGQDREEMVNGTYAGLGRDFTIHDKWATEGEGPIQDRTTEHLGQMDLAVATGRQVLLKAIRELQEGREPANVVRDEDLNDLPVAPFVIHAPKGTDWEAYCHYVEGLARENGEWSRVAK
ncbi:MAG TPA: Rieske 2Fe-2S domain-containing protein [Chloroflexota bacterium]